MRSFRTPATRIPNPSGVGNKVPLPLKIFGVLFLLAYTVRFSKLDLLIGDMPADILYQFLIAISIVIIVIFVQRRYMSKGVNVAAILFVLFALLASLFSEDREVALLKWVAWALLLVIVGPIIKDNRIAGFHSYIWKIQQHILLFLTLASFVLLSIGMNYGKGTSGITAHSMVLGPFAAISALMLLPKVRQNIFLLVPLIVSILTCVAAGSRTALLGLCVGMVAMPAGVFKSSVKRYRYVGILLVAALIMWINSDIFSFESFDAVGDYGSIYVKDLVDKGIYNTRDELWRQRIAEFKSSPLIGVGLGVVGEGFMLRSEYGSMIVEPGSSYLALLSMTGLGGTSLFIVLVWNIFTRVRPRWDKFTVVERCQNIGIGSFWAIHAVSEGWIYAAGSILCMMFWLWISTLLVPQIDSQKKARKFVTV